MKTIHATQDAVLSKPALFAVNLIEIKTYTLRQTLKRTYRFSSSKVTYNSLTWHPFLLEVGELRSSMRQVQELRAGEGTGLYKTWTVKLYNGTLPDSGKRLWQDLKENFHQSAEVKWSQILLSDPPDDKWFDLDAAPHSFAGNEDTVFFRGEFLEATRITNESVELTFKTIVDTPIRYKLAIGEATTDPRDVGTTLPYTFGVMVGVDGLGWKTPSGNTGDHIYIVSGEKADDITAVKAISKSSGASTTLTLTTHYTKQINNTSLGFPTVATSGVATVTMTWSQVQTVVGLLGDPEPVDGEGLDIFATVRGMEAESGYTVASGVLMEKFVDQVRFIVQKYASSRLAVDTTNLTAVATALGANIHAFVLNTLGDNETIETLISHLCYEARVNCHLDERSSSSIVFFSVAHGKPADWPASVATIDDFESMFETPKQELTQRSRFSAGYRWRSELGAVGDPQSYTAALQVNENTNDLSATLTAQEISDAQDKLGQRDHPLFLYRTVRDTPTAKNIMEFHVRESINNNPLYNLVGVPHSQSYKLEVGDIIDFVPDWSRTPTQENGEKVEARILETTKRLDNATDIVAVSVRTTIL